MIQALKSSGLVTESAVISAVPARLMGLTVLTDGSNSATVILYDSASSAEGTVLDKVILAAADRTGRINYSKDGVQAANGIYASLTNANVVVHFVPGMKA